MLKSPFRSTWDALPKSSECGFNASDCDFNASECHFKASDYDFRATECDFNASDFYPETSEHYLKAFDSYFTFSKRKLWGNDKNILLLFALRWKFGLVFCGKNGSFGISCSSFKLVSAQ